MLILLNEQHLLRNSKADKNGHESGPYEAQSAVDGIIYNFALCKDERTKIKQY